MNIVRLDATIKVVCPIHGVSSDRVISFKDEATQEQREAAQAIANEWVFDDQSSLLVICSPWQIRKALNTLGLRQAVEDAVAASNDITLKDGWEFATEFRSDDPFVMSMGISLGKSEQETRDLIVFATTL